MSGRARPRLLAAATLIVAASFGGQPARAASSGPSDPGLTSSVAVSGTGALVSTVQTSSLRAAIPPSPVAPRVLIIGTGVARALFPTALQPSILAATSAADLTDTHGYGTIAASTIMQLLPNATITSRLVRAYDATWTLLDMGALASALEDARANASKYDLVLLAFPPQAALDPISDLTGHVRYGAFGNGMEMAEEALLSTNSPTQGPVAGIPADASLRDKLFAGTDAIQRNAVERFAASALAWRRVVSDVSALSSTGVPIVAPAGDFTKRDANGITSLDTQTVYGLSALSNVITVGAAYDDSGIETISPTSGRGPTLGLAMKPDLLAPSDVMTMLPGTSALNWQDDSSREPLQTLQWANANVVPTACPSVTNAYRCVLQGSTMTSASVVAANLAALVASGVPNSASARAAGDDEILRGIAWAAASTTRAQAYGEARDAFGWEQGAGVLTGLRGVDPSTLPVALARPTFGEVAPNAPASVSIPLWSRGAVVSAARATLTSVLGADPSGAAVTAPLADTSRVTATPRTSALSLTATAGKFDGGLYDGALTLTTAAGKIVLPLDLLQDVSVDMHVDYAYNELQGNGVEGERVEGAGVVLFAGMPDDVGLVGKAFKNFGGPSFASAGGDPTNEVIIRSAVTGNSFTGAVPASQHGRAHITAVPPGFYKFHVLTDHAFEATQARGRDESLGIGLASSGPDAANIPGVNVLIPSCSGSGFRGPLSCAPRTNVDQTTGLCQMRTAATAFNLYCGEIAYAVPTAIVSRAIHLISNDSSSSNGDWNTCNVNVPLDGTTLDLGQVVQSARACGGVPAPTSWNTASGAPDCLGPSERARFPQGHPADVTASYTGPSGAGVPGRNLPVDVMTYDFDLPALNTYTNATLALSYVSQNAIVAARFWTGNATVPDASNSLLVVDDPSVAVQPALHEAGARGSASQAWSVMSGNATTGHLSLVMIPTAWSRAALDQRPIASVELCDVALRVSTFAKTPWNVSGRSGTSALQSVTTLDRGLLSQIDPTRMRVRPAYDASTGTFGDAGAEAEGAMFAVQVPKDTTAEATSARHVRSPAGGPAYLDAARAIGGSSADVRDPGFSAYDPARGLTSLACNERAPDPSRAAVCKAWDAARAANTTLAELGPDLSTNGRFAGVLPLDDATLRRAAGNVAYELTDGDAGTSFDRHWAGARFPVSDFYDEVGSPLQVAALSGILQVTKDSSGTPVLTVRAPTPAGPTYTISSTLR